MFVHQTSGKLEVNLPIKCNSLKFSHIHPFQDLWGLLERTMLGGGFKYFLFVTPTWGNDPIWRAYFFQMAWFNHQPGTMDLPISRTFRFCFFIGFTFLLASAKNQVRALASRLQDAEHFSQQARRVGRWIDFMAATLWLISGEASMDGNSTHIFG